MVVILGLAEVGVGREGQQGKTVSSNPFKNSARLKQPPPEENSCSILQLSHLKN